MRPTFSWSDLPGRRVGIYGLGREGEAGLRACRARGIEPVLVDDVARPGGLDGRPVLTGSEGGLAALAGCDVVIKSPGISRYGPAVQGLLEAGVAVVGGLGLWLEEADRSRVVCITGTKGKSTTSAIAGHLLAGLGHRVLLGGNIGVPPFDPLVAGEYDYWVIEVSSYQATDLTSAPPVVGVTSLNPDHLPWHSDDVETYYRDKLSLCRRPGARWTVANGDSELIRERRDQLGPQVEWVHAAEAAWTAPLGLLGVHNRRNALIAAALLRRLGVPGADDESALAAAAAGFAGLESRLQVIGTVGGVSFVDDGLSTNVLGTLAAVEAFADRRVALILGGQDRGIDYTALAEGLRARSTGLLALTVPDNGPRINQVLTATGAGPAVTVEASADVEDAVARGYEWAGPDGVVLLSPAAPSFGRFRDYRHRGQVFAAAMAKLADRGSDT